MLPFMVPMVVPVPVPVPIVVPVPVPDVRCLPCLEQYEANTKAYAPRLELSLTQSRSVCVCAFDQLQS